MTAELWEPTKRVCLGVAKLEALLADEKDATKRTSMQALVNSRRAESSPYWITVRHVGSPANPFLWMDTTDEWVACVENCKAEARIKLKDMGDGAFAFVFGDEWTEIAPPPKFGDAVRILAQRSPRWRDGFKLLLRTRISASCGVETFDRLAVLGEPIILEAHEHVQNFNTLEPIMGEG